MKIFEKQINAQIMETTILEHRGINIVRMRQDGEGLGSEAAS
jgi:hypothetical protein